MEANGKDIITAESPWEVWTANAIGNLLAASPELAIGVSSRQIADALWDHVDARRDSSIRGLEKSIGMPAGSFHRWLRQDAAPTLDLLLQCCNRLNTSPARLLNASDGVPNTQRSPLSLPSQPAPPQRERFDEPHYRNLLIDVLADEDTVPPSMAAVARKLGYQYSNLQARFPDLSRAISARYLLYQRKLAESKKRARCETVREITFQIHREGDYPNARRVCARLEQRNYWRLPEVRAAWLQALSELIHEGMGPGENALGPLAPGPEA